MYPAGKIYVQLKNALLEDPEHFRNLIEYCDRLVAEEQPVNITDDAVVVRRECFETIVDTLRTECDAPIRPTPLSLFTDRPIIDMVVDVDGEATLGGHRLYSESSQRVNLSNAS